MTSNFIVFFLAKIQIAKDRPSISIVWLRLLQDRREQSNLCLFRFPHEHGKRRLEQRRDTNMTYTEVVLLPLKIGINVPQLIFVQNQNLAVIPGYPGL